MAGILDMRVKLYSSVDAVAYGDHDWEGTLNSFWEENQDGMDWGDITAIARELNERGRYFGGGGAAAEFFLVRVGEAVPSSEIEQLRARVAELEAELAALKAGTTAGIAVRSKVWVARNG